MKQLIGFRMMCTKHNSPVLIDEGQSIAAMEEGEQNKGDYFFDTSECYCQEADRLLEEKAAAIGFNGTDEEHSKLQEEFHCSDDWSITPIFEV